MFVSILFSVTLSLPAFGHGGGLDSQGGHNCNVGSCAGTYHCHQAWGPGCGGGTSSDIDFAPLTPKCVDEYSSKMTKRNWAKVQKLLKASGYSPGRIDGKFGPKTQKALREYERDLELNVSSGSRVQPETLRSLGAFCS